MPPKLRQLKKQVSLTSQPPQHPYENDPNHRSFLSRSLTKSDVEISALIALNVSLKELKDYIVNKYGMDVLLDVGEGFILVEENDTDTTHSGKDFGKEQQEKEVLVFKHASTDNNPVDTFDNHNDNNDKGVTVSEKKEDDKDDNDNSITPMDVDEAKSAAGTSNDNTQNLDVNLNDNNSSDGGDSQGLEKESSTNDKKQKDVDTTTPTKSKSISKPYSTPPPQYQHLLSTNPHFYPVLKNFILRLKLRRKLLNRLSRRLLRLSYAMDGKLHKINPPMLPKYGTTLEKKHYLNNQKDGKLKEIVGEWEKYWNDKEHVLETLWQKKEELYKELNIHVHDNVKDIVETVEDSKKVKEIADDGGKEQGRNIAKSDDSKVEEQEENVDDEVNTASPIKEEPTNKEETELEVKGDSYGSSSLALNESEKQKVEEGAMKLQAKEMGSNGTIENDASEEPKENTKEETETNHVNAEEDEGGDENKMDIDIQDKNKHKSESELDQKLVGDREEAAQPEPENVVSSSNATASDETEVATTTIMTESNDSGTTPKTNILSGPFSNNPFIFDPEHSKDMEKLIRYDSDYSKKVSIHIPSSTILRRTTALTKEELDALDKDEDDFDDIASSNRHGIGAVSKFMTKKEKVMEWKRWQTEFLSKIPDQPTFQELGMLNKVFMLEERRKLAKQCSKVKGDNKKNNDAEGKAEEGNYTEEEMDVDKKEEATIEWSKRRSRENDHDDKNEEVGDDENKKNRKDTDIEQPIMKRKRMSLDPVPSFYQQDYTRILMIQNASLSTALATNVRDNYVQAKNDYDTIFERSQELQSRKIAIEEELSKASYDFRIKVNHINNSIAHERHKWESEKKAFEAQRLQRIQYQAQMMGQTPSPAFLEAVSMSDDRMVKRAIDGAIDRVVIRTEPEETASGSHATSVRLYHAPNDSIQRGVATTMAHCIDTVVKRVKSGYIPDSIIDKGKGGEQFPAFVPPASTHPDHVVMNKHGENFTQLKKRLEAEIVAVKSKLDVSEASRAKAWSRLNKAQAALNASGGNSNMSTVTAKTSRPKSSVTMTQRSQPQQPAQRYNVAPRQQPQPPAPQHQRHHVYPTAPTSSVTMANNPAIASAAAAAAAVKANMNYGHSQMSQQQASQIAQMSSQVVPSSIRLVAPSTPAVTTTSSASENKYSLEKVRARILSDGTVLPVSKLKKGKDGLYLRPAGRQRKGMDWDAVNGRWVPQGTLPQRYG